MKTNGKSKLFPMMGISGCYYKNGGDGDSGSDGDSNNEAIESEVGQDVSEQTEDGSFDYDGDDN